jgi:hypothetical protein
MGQDVITLIVALAACGVFGIASAKFVITFIDWRKFRRGPVTRHMPGYWW